MKVRLLIGCLLLALAAVAAGCVITTEKPADSIPPPVPPPPAPAATAASAPVAAEALPTPEPEPTSAPTTATSAAPAASVEGDAGTAPAWNQKSEKSPQRDAAAGPTEVFDGKRE
jgi:hypothetical protein